MAPFLILFDSHVHIYDCYSIKRFFSFVQKNFENQSAKLGSEKYIGVLFLTETRNEDYFQKLNKNLFESDLNELNLKRVKNNESDSIVYESKNNNYIVIIPGRQIITSEKLEVLSVGSSKYIDYDKSLKQSVDMIELYGALPVLPWGVGKWAGKRKKIIEDFLESNEDLKYFLGDNGGRPVFWSTPGLFKTADKKGILILRGSDPLPLREQEEKVGKFGFYIRANFDLNYPAKEINNLLLNLKKSPDDFGKLETPLNFIKNQFLMQLRKIF